MKRQHLKALLASALVFAPFLSIAQVLSIAQAPYCPPTS